MTRPLPKYFKRHRYNDYSKISDDMPEILQRLSKTPRGGLSQVADETGIPLSTLSRWHQGLIKNPNFNPLDRKWGEHRRIFTDEEEDSLADFIMENYIIPGLHFTDADFKDLAMQAWYEKYMPMLESEDEEVRKQYKEFHCSAGFIADFKYHHMFSSKVFHLKRRSDPNSEVEKKFMEEMKELFRTVPLDRILNADESGWKLLPKGLLTWGETGVDNMSRQGNVNDKSQVTVLATITASKTKLPLLFVAQGKTTQVENSQIGDVGYHWKAHSESGWVTDEVFSYYLHKIREHFNDDDPLHLVMDLYPSHMTDRVLQDAKDLNIIIHIIPAGLTDVYQPLDRKIFGILKAKARYYFRMRRELGKPITATKAEACQDMVKAWEGVLSGMIGSAWEIYIEDENTSLQKVQNDKLKAHHREYVAQLREESIRRRIERRSEEGYKDLTLD